MPDKMVAMLIRFLEQNNGSLSKRAQEKEFKDLTSEEIKKVESQYKITFGKDWGIWSNKWRIPAKGWEKSGYAPGEMLLNLYGETHALWDYSHKTIYPR